MDDRIAEDLMLAGMFGHSLDDGLSEAMLASTYNTNWSADDLPSSVSGLADDCFELPGAVSGTVAPFDYPSPPTSHPSSFNEATFFDELQLDADLLASAVFSYNATTYDNIAPTTEQDFEPDLSASALTNLAGEQQDEEILTTYEQPIATPWYQDTLFDTEPFFDGIPNMFGSPSPQAEHVDWSAVIDSLEPLPAEPIPQQVIEIAGYINDMPKLRKNENGVLTFPSRHALRSDEGLKAYREVNRKTGYLKIKERGGKLRDYYGDERLFSADMWRFLTDKTFMTEPKSVSNSSTNSMMSSFSGTSSPKRKNRDSVTGIDFVTGDTDETLSAPKKRRKRPMGSKASKDVETTCEDGMINDKATGVSIGVRGAENDDDLFVIDPTIEAGGGGANEPAALLDDNTSANAAVEG